MDSRIDQSYSCYWPIDTRKECSTEILDISVNLYQEGDECDSETFRVKRRSSSKLEHRNTPESVHSSFENQLVTSDV
ncbi:transcription factor jumonji (jmj) family protein / zinc finger (C5HC2 type) family protein [Artemisia annua]|uniref:Transcription factor jumonji (Jmj) family protein / zinc finger (C5HC2 type) family protein n=1 Tax=Artemisia annua TaxID=35608 RepID=A0A2U1LWL1_ARTAN|nr:transcription factor jumonji (jmj) family protein / zinc finger (C5HC2 type) family protein [Artemisia annua]